MTEDLRGERFGRLVVLRQASPDKSGRARWECRCDCGKTTIAAAVRLKRGLSNSCGCLRLDKVKASSITHGITRQKDDKPRIPKIYQTWANIKTRCTNPKTPYYDRYGGRGIKVCDEWMNDFQSFYDWAIANGYQEGLQIDRIDNDGDYTLENCRWVTKEVNANNKRNNLVLEQNGKRHTAAEWSRITGISQKAIYTRIKAGKTQDEVLRAEEDKNDR